VPQVDGNIDKGQGATGGKKTRTQFYGEFTFLVFSKVEKCFGEIYSN